MTSGAEKRDLETKKKIGLEEKGGGVGIAGRGDHFEGKNSKNNSDWKNDDRGGHHHPEESGKTVPTRGETYDGKKAKEPNDTMVDVHKAKANPRNTGGTPGKREKRKKHEYVKKERGRGVGGTRKLGKKVANVHIVGKKKKKKPGNGAKKGVGV